jgi:hypothetical protein
VKSPDSITTALIHKYRNEAVVTEHYLIELQRRWTPLAKKVVATGGIIGVKYV